MISNIFKFLESKVVVASITGLLILSSCSTPDKNKPSQNSKSAQGLSELELKLDVKKYTLDNGLRVLILENKKLPIYSYYTFYDVGGRYESKGTTGATHFLEHMMFKGAKKYGPGEFHEMIEGEGGSTNAYTTFDSTVYYENLPSHTLEKMVDMEADRLQHILLDPVAFEKERGVVLEERKLRYENSPRGKLFLQMMKNVFVGTPYGGSVIGDAEDVKGLDRKRMREFFNTFYRPNNAIIVIVGDVDAQKTIKIIKEKFSQIPRSEGLEKLKKDFDVETRFSHRGKYKRSVDLYGNSPTPMFMIAYKGKKITDREAFVYDIVGSVLGDGDSSYLKQRYVKSRRPMLSRIGVGNYKLKHNGVVFVSGQLLPKVSLNSFKRNFAKNAKKMCRKAVTSRSVQKTKNQYLLQFYGEIQTNNGLASFLGLRENHFGDYGFYNKELKIYSSITVDEVRNACEKIFAKNENIFLTVWNKNKKGKK